MQSTIPTWHALYVRPRLERAASKALRTLGFEEYLPLYRVPRRWSDRVKQLDTVLFPGYLFCRFTYADRLRVLNAPGVHGIVGLGKTAAPIDESEINAVRRVLASGRAIAPWTYLPIGQNVVIQDGVFAGLRGVVIRTSDTARVVVSVQALDRSISIEVDRDCITSRLPVERNSATPSLASMEYGNPQA